MLPNYGEANIVIDPYQNNHNNDDQGAEYEEFANYEYQITPALTRNDLDNSADDGGNRSVNNLQSHFFSSSHTVLANNDNLAGHQQSRFSRNIPDEARLNQGSPESAEAHSNLDHAVQSKNLPENSNLEQTPKSGTYDFNSAIHNVKDNADRLYESRRDITENNQG